MESSADILVVGLGPVGATLSALLAKLGLSVIAIDKDSDVYPLPRAAHFDHEIMRLFQQLGIADEVAQHARVASAYEFRNAKGDVLQRFELAGRPSPSGWPQSFMFHQPGMERALRALLARAPNVDVRLNRRLKSFVQDGKGVTATLDSAGGDERVRSRYLVGCDGASSVVREACGIGLSSYDFDEPWLVIDAIPGPSAKLPDINLQICDPARPTTCVLMGPGRHRWEFMLKPDETAEQVLADDFIRSLLAPWGCTDTVAIDRKAVYRFHGLVAERWRDGHALLAGDAAHQTPPFAGQGMCAGLRDAANLSWKLAAILSGGANDTLLDTYQSEREPHVRAMIELAIGMGRMVCTTDPAVAAARDSAMLAQRAAGNASPPPLGGPPFQAGCVMSATSSAGTLFPQPWANGEKLDDVIGDGAWLIAQSPLELAPTLPIPLQFKSLDDAELAPFVSALRNWLKQNDADAVLVRPDRYVFGTGVVGDLVPAFAHVLYS